MRPRPDGGFTVVESLIALTVLSMGFLALATVIPTFKSDLVGSDQRTRATFLAEQTAERLHSLEFHDPLLLDGNHVDLSPPAHYTVSWTVASNTPAPSMKKVTVNVVRDNGFDGATLTFLHAEAGR